MALYMKLIRNSIHCLWIPQGLQLTFIHFHFFGPWEMKK